MKIWQNAFQSICIVSFFDAVKISGDLCAKSIRTSFFRFEETGVLEELGGPERRWHVCRKKFLPVVRLFLGDCLDEGVNDSICVKDLDLG